MNMNEYPSKRIDKAWIQKGITNEAVDWAKSFGQFLASNQGGTKALTTSQIRKFFGELKRIQADPIKFKEEIPLLKSKLAYAVGRDVKSKYFDKKNHQEAIVYKTKLKEFYNELEMGLNFYIETQKIEDFKRFVKMVESIVAYHKFYGGKDNK